jgi:GcrA cell cycle regulator
MSSRAICRDCRYPYGGDERGEAITFCGHPQRAGSSYCAAHFDLSIGPGTASERAADRALLTIVERHERRTELTLAQRLFEYPLF